MSKESALKFLNTLGTNERAKELLNNRKKPENFEEQAKIYSETAAELGEQITPEDFMQATQELEARIKKKTEAAASDLVSLEDDQVEDIAGGFYYHQGKYTKVYECCYDFVDTDCWWEDACELLQVNYNGCSGEYFHVGK